MAMDDVQFVLPLNSGRFYSLRSFCEESNRKLGTHYQLEKTADRQIELRGLERAALLLADDAGLFKAQFESDRLVLTISDRQDDQSRRIIRDRLSRILRVPISSWPSHLGIHLPKDFDSSRPTVLLTHGLEGDALSLQPMTMVFVRRGVQVATFDFPNDGPIAWSGDRLSTELKELVVHHPRLHVAIVGHSMGGLVARYCARNARQESRLRDGRVPPGDAKSRLLPGRPSAAH